MTRLRDGAANVLKRAMLGIVNIQDMQKHAAAHETVIEDDPAPTAMEVATDNATLMEQNDSGLDSTAGFSNRTEPLPGCSNALTGSVQATASQSFIPLTYPVPLDLSSPKVGTEFVAYWQKLTDPGNNVVEEGHDVEKDGEKAKDNQVIP